MQRASCQPLLREDYDVIGEDKLEVRMFVLADWAAIPPDGKLYLGGAGVNSVRVDPIPGVLPALYLVVRVRVPWHLTSERLPFGVQLLDADRQPIGTDPLAAGAAETGRPPGARPGDEFAVQFVLSLGGIPVNAAGTAFFHLTMAETPLGILPLKIEHGHA